MQTAQSLAEMGLSIWVVELLDQVLPGYFDQKASAIIQKAYESNRVNSALPLRWKGSNSKKRNYILSLKGGKDLNARFSSLPQA